MYRTAGRIESMAQALARDAAAAGEVPPTVAEEARRAIVRRFAGTGRPVRSRVEAYFWGVVRRRAMRGGAPSVHQRLLLTSFVEELTAAGHSSAGVYEELRRVYGGSVDPALLESFAPAHAA